MSDFTVGKIANNSVTLLLMSDDENAEIEKRYFIADANFTGTDVDDVFNGATVTIESLSSELTTIGNRVPADNWFDNVFGLAPPAPFRPQVANGTAVNSGEYWVVTAYAAAAAGDDWRSCVKDENDIDIFSTAQINALLGVNAGAPPGGPYIIKTNFPGGPKTLGAGNAGYKLHIQEEHIGTSRVVAGDGVGVHNGTIGIEDHYTFKIDIPNIINYPNKTRCLVQVNGLYFNRGESLENLFVRIPELQPLNYYVGGKQGTGVICVVRSLGYNQIEREHPIPDIIQNGVLCQTPFGKRVTVKINKGFFGDKTIDDNSWQVYARPIAIELRILFLDINDLKDI
eukprot:SAG11_NODE_6290_length_1343_cov_424.344855_2_plen_341_part_00